MSENKRIPDKCVYFEGYVETTGTEVCGLYGVIGSCEHCKDYKEEW